MQAVTELFPHSGQRLARQGESTSVMNLEVHIGVCALLPNSSRSNSGQGTSFCTENVAKEMNCIQK